MFFTLTLVSMAVVVPVSGLHSVISNSREATHFQEYHGEPSTEAVMDLFVWLLFSLWGESS